MKKLMLLLFFYCPLLTFSNPVLDTNPPLNEPLPMACSADYEENNGLVVMEAENLAYGSSWRKRTSYSGYTGSGYITWEGADYFNSPGNGLIRTKIQINKAGTYRFQWRSRVGKGTNSTEHNDNWLRFPDADDFYAQKGSSILYPKGSGKSPNPAGSGSGGWFKVYLSGTTGWTWSTKTSDNNSHDIFVRFDTPGVYTMEISARSAYHLLDRIVLHSSVSDPLNNSNPETSCDSSSNVPVTGISLTPSSMSLAEGSTGQLSINISPSNATNQNLSWSTSNSAVATVSSNGKVFANSAGTAVITATTQDGGYKDTTTVTVSGSSTVPVTGITLTPSSMSLADGSTGQLTITISPSNATNQNLSWSTSNSAIATVSSNGKVFANSPGTATITATTVDGGYKDSTTVTVSGNSTVPVTGITLTPGSMSLADGSTGQLTIAISPSNATNQDLTWSTTNSAIATVSSNGKVFANSPGTATITATTVDGGYKDSTTVTVSGSSTVPVTGITLTPGSLSLEEGTTGQLTITISPSNATNQNLDWSTGNTAIATVTSKGKVFANGVGTTTITATTEDGGYKDSTTITVTNGNSTVPVTGINLTPGTMTLAEGSTGQLTIDISPSNATNQNLNWSTGNTAIATVTSKGKVFANGVGTTTITATTEDGGFKDSTTITVTNSSGGQSVTSFTLYNASTDQPLMSLFNGLTIDYDEVKGKALTIVANTNPGVVGSVYLELSGSREKTQTENVAPYALYGDSGNGNFSGPTFNTGTYTIKATPYGAASLGGTKGTSLTITFSIVDQSNATSSKLNTQKSDTPQTSIEDGVSVYPNPVKDGRFTAQIPGLTGQSVSYALYNSLGMNVSSGTLSVQKNSTEISFDLSEVMRVRGIYFLTLRSENMTAPAKITLVNQ